MWKQHLAQEAPKSLADKSQQGILREMRLETEQVYGHYFICQRLILDSLSRIAVFTFLYWHVEKRNKAPYLFLFLGDSYRKSFLVWRFVELLLALFIPVVSEDL